MTLTHPKLPGLALALALALVAQSDKQVTFKARVLSVDGEDKLTAEIHEPVCGLAAGDRVPIQTTRSHNAAPGTTATLEVTYLYGRKSNTYTCPTQNGRLLARLTDIR